MIRYFTQWVKTMLPLYVEQGYLWTRLVVTEPNFRLLLRKKLRIWYLEQRLKNLEK